MDGRRLYIIAAILVALLCLSVGAAQSEPRFKDISGSRYKNDILTVANLNILQGNTDGTFKPDRPLTEAEFLKVVERLVAAAPSLVQPQFKTSDPKAKVARVRAYLCVTRCASDADLIDAIKDPDQIVAGFADAKTIPAWGVKYVAYAVRKGFIAAEGKFRPQELITRAELAGLVAKMLPTTVPAAVDPNVFTGLIIDGRDVGLMRCLNPALLDESGAKLYPDLRHMPSYDFIEAKGLFGYTTSPDKTERAGANPLIIQAIAASGPATAFAVISNTDRDAMLEAEKKGHFLLDWKVVFLVK